MVKIQRLGRVAALLAPMLVLACGEGGSKSDSAGGNIATQRAAADTGHALSVTPAEGGVAKLTPTDTKSVYNAGKYKLTDENFRQFIVATDSVLALRARDPQVRDFLDKNITDAGNGTESEVWDAGRKRLEGYPAIKSAIEGTGMSVKDYFVAAIAIAQAERHMGNPSAAPSTATGRINAEFLNQHKSELSALRAQGNGAIIVR
jgi:hypothetical protein